MLCPASGSVIMNPRPARMSWAPGRLCGRYKPARSVTAQISIAWSASERPLGNVCQHPRMFHIGLPNSPQHRCRWYFLKPATIPLAPELVWSSYTLPLHAHPFALRSIDSLRESQSFLEPLCLYWISLWLHPGSMVTIGFETISTSIQHWFFGSRKYSSPVNNSTVCHPVWGILFSDRSFLSYILRLANAMNYPPKKL
jgi:hypothetical protein